MILVLFELDPAEGRDGAYFDLAAALKPELEKRGYEVAVFHATGMGGRAFESLAAQANMRMRIVETPKHASSDSLKQVQCVSCGQTLQVLLEAKMVFCPSCSTVSPCDGSETAASASVAAPARTLPRRGIFNCIAKAFS